MPLGHHQLLATGVVVLYEQGHRPVANVVICYGTLSSAVSSIVDMLGDRVCSRERHHSVVTAPGESLAPCVMVLLMRNRLDKTVTLPLTSVKCYQIQATFDSYSTIHYSNCVQILSCWIKFFFTACLLKCGLYQWKQGCSQDFWYTEVISPPNPPDQRKSLQWFIWDFSYFIDSVRSRSWMEFSFWHRDIFPNSGWGNATKKVTVQHWWFGLLVYPKYQLND